MVTLRPPIQPVNTGLRVVPAYADGRLSVSLLKIWLTPTLVFVLLPLTIPVTRPVFTLLPRPVPCRLHEAAQLANRHLVLAPLEILQSHPILALIDISTRLALRIAHPETARGVKTPLSATVGNHRPGRSG